MANGFLDESGVLELTKSIFNEVDNRINATKSSITEVITGNIDEVVPLDNRRTDVIYLQRNSETDARLNKLIWVKDLNSWVNLGSASIKSSGDNT